MSKLTYLAEINQEKLEDYERMRYENTQLRQELRSLERQLKAINYIPCCTELKPKQECYKSGEPCEYDCSGLCKESC
jgi:hypothetical protein